MEKIRAIYCIRNKVTDKVYIGSAMNFKVRKSQHLSSLRKNKHHSIHLQRSWNKYGGEAFEFSVLEKIEDKENLIQEEQKWMDYYCSYNEYKGYNISPTAGNSSGVKRTKEFCDGMSRRLSGKKLTEEHKRNISLSKRGEKNPMYGKKHSPARVAQSKQQNAGAKNPFYGETHSEISLQKMRQPRNMKYKKPLEHIQKITEAMIGTKRKKSILTEKMVNEIRELRETEKLKLKEIAERYNISPTHAGKICRHEIWKL